MVVWLIGLGEASPIDVPGSNKASVAVDMKRTLRIRMWLTDRV